MLDINALSVSDQAILAGLLAKAATPGAAAVPAPKAKRRPSESIKYLTEQELEQFFRAITSARDRAIFRIIYHRGLRASEVAAIQLSDWNVKDDRLSFKRRKGSAGGEYHLCSSEVKALRAWVRERGHEPGALFTSNRGRGVSRQMLDVLMKGYGAKAGLPVEKRHCHALKHSCATHLLNKGESIEDVQDHLGHREVKNTQIYAKFTNQRRHARDKRLRDW